MGASPTVDALPKKKTTTLIALLVLIATVQSCSSLVFVAPNNRLGEIVRSSFNDGVRNGIAKGRMIRISMASSARAVTMSSGVAASRSFHATAAARNFRRPMCFLSASASRYSPSLLHSSGRSDDGAFGRRKKTGVRMLSVVPSASNRIEIDDDEDRYYDLEGSLFPVVEKSSDVVAAATPVVEIEQEELSKTTAVPPLVNGSVPPPQSERPENVLLEGLKSRPKEGGKWIPSNPLGWTSKFGLRSAETDERLVRLIRLKPGDEGYFDVSGITVPNVSIVNTKEQSKIVMDILMNSDPSILHACDTEVMDIDLSSVGPVGNGYVTCLSMYSGPDFDYGLGDGPGSVLWIDNLDDSCGLLQEFKTFFEDERFRKVWHNYGFDRHVMWNEGIDVHGFGGDTMHMARLQDTSRARYGRGNGYSLEALTEDLVGKRKKPMKEIFGVKRLRKDGTEGSLVDIPPVEVLQRDPKFRSNWILYSAYDAEGTWRIRNELEKKLHNMPWVKGNDLFFYYDKYMRKFGEVLTDMERRGIRVNADPYLAGVEVQAREDRARHVSEFRKWASSQIGPDGLALNPASSVQLCTFLFGGAMNSKTREMTERVRVFKVPTEEIPEEALLAYKNRDRELLESSNQASEETQKDEFDHMTGLQLRKVCKEQGLKVTGKKSDLQERLRGYFLSSKENGDASSPLDDTSKVEDDFDTMKVAQLKELCREHDLKVSGKKSELQERLRGHFSEKGNDDSSSMVKDAGDSVVEDDFNIMTEDDLRDACVARGLDDRGSRKTLLDRLRGDSAFALEILSASSPRDSDGYKTISEKLEAAAKDGSALEEILSEIREKSQADPKFMEVTVTSIGMEPEKFTAGGAPSVTADVLRKLAGEPFGDEPKYGKAYDFFGGGEAGHDACVALYSLCAIGSIDTMIANFLTSLQSLADQQSRVHCSLNLNTETGRLSSRRPNLQNQPALEKDKYKIRKAFASSPGNNLIVADYGQLELRLLASMTDCKSMIEAFNSGGDFHSRTALGMFDYIQKKVDAGDCLLEWDYSKGDPPKPMLKDEFASERRKAKTLNFSIAYGKTAHGLSQDWGVSTKEAEKMLQAWYNSRPEVLKWQQETKRIAKKKGITRTLMGRYRQLPDAKGSNRKLIGHAERASINTPIQGGAADVAMMAMIKINDSELLKRLGWILLMQIHDEVILEGPEETAEEAFAEVKKCMEEPWVFGLDETSVPLLVDGSYIHKDWYEAK